MTPAPPPATQIKIRLPEPDEDITEEVVEMVRVAGMPTGTRVEIDFYGAISVGFGFPDVTLGDLIDIRSYVVEIVEGFAPAFA